MQLAEALGPDNKFFCSCYFCREVTDADTLLMYFVRSGGAADFARRWNQAMSDDNRWFCSMYYNQPVRDERTLWIYYMRNRSDNRDKGKSGSSTG
jgi:hypothetical protein